MAVPPSEVISESTAPRVSPPHAGTIIVTNSVLRAMAQIQPPMPRRALIRINLQRNIRTSQVAFYEPLAAAPAFESS